MLGRIVRLSLAHPGMIMLAALLLLGFGVVTIRNARYDVFPEFVPAQASVQAEAAGMTPDQVEALVTRPLETAINGATGVQSVRSESIQGLSVIQVVFVEGSDPYRARQIVAEAISEAAGQLPAGVQPPRMGPLTSSTMDLLKIGFTGGAIPSRCAISCAGRSCRGCSRRPASLAPSSSAASSAGSKCASARRISWRATCRSPKSKLR